MAALKLTSLTVHAHKIRIRQAWYFCWKQAYFEKAGDWTDQGVSLFRFFFLPFFSSGSTFGWSLRDFSWDFTQASHVVRPALPTPWTRKLRMNFESSREAQMLYDRWGIVLETKYRTHPGGSHFSVDIQPKIFFENLSFKKIDELWKFRKSTCKLQSGFVTYWSFY